MAPRWTDRKAPNFIQRIARYMTKGVIYPLVSFISFTILLTFIMVLWKPSPGPSRIMRIGWQEWDAVYFSDDAYTPPSTGDNKEEDDSTEWWNVDHSADEDPYSAASLPLDVWLPLQVHDTGITEITVERCFLDHAYGYCYPQTTADEDSRKGKWTLVDRDLQQKNGIYYMAFYYRRTRRLDTPLITDFALLPANSSPSNSSIPDPSWHKAERSVREGVMGQAPLYLWYKLGKSRGEMDDEDVNGIITEVDIINGEGPPFWGFDKLDTPLSTGRPGGGENVYMTYRRGIKRVPQAKPLHFHHNGTFRILQIADLHFSVSHGRCIDTDLSPCDGGDDETLSLMRRTLDLEKPDMVIFSGDQLNGKGTSWDPRSVLAKFAQPVIERNISWAAVLGNHDDEDDVLTRSEIVKILKAMPYSLVQTGPDWVHGASNYVLPVYSPDASKTQLLTLYMLDSGGYSAGVFDWFGFTPTEYDYIRQSQIDWFLEESERAPLLARPFHPDTGTDLGGQWKRGAADVGMAKRDSETRLKKPTGMMFYHIPIQETYNTPDIDTQGVKLDVGQQLDGPGHPKKNEGFFDKALMKAKAGEEADPELEIKVVGNGHSHLSDNCRRVQGIWFCFNGGSSYSGYGKVGVDRRFRVFELSSWGERIETYERTEKGDQVDRLVLLAN